MAYRDDREGIPTGNSATTQRPMSPQMRFAILPFCNLKCFYCSPEGEGYSENLRERMSREEISRIAKIAATVGVTHVKVTGGEPLLRRDVIDIVADLAAINGIKEVQMVTNGTLLPRKADALKAAGLSSLTLSIDAADPHVYRAIRGGRLAPVLDGLSRSRAAGLPVRINMVLMRHNFDQVGPMLKLAEEYGASLKLLDVMDLQRPAARQFWEREFVDFRELRTILENMGAQFAGYEAAPGGIGAPLLRFVMPGSVEVLLKDSTIGGHYHDSCNGCLFFPCQDALISIRVTHDGHLKRCLMRNDNLVDVLSPLRAGDEKTVMERIGESFMIMAGSTFSSGLWQPHLDSFGGAGV